MSKVLLADDSKPIRKVVEMTLSQDFDLEVVADGDQALELLDAGFTPELALIDVHMPRMDGLELCREIQRRQPRAQVLLLVGTFEPFDEDEARLAGAAGHMLKPFSADDLRAKVTSMLDAAQSGRRSEEPHERSGDSELSPSREGAREPEPTADPTGSVPSMLAGEGSDTSESESVGADEVSDDVAEGAEEAATAAVPKQEIAAPMSDQVEPSARLRLADGDLDALARQVARYLAETLFAGSADELFARVARDEVRARIERLEREAEAESVDNDEGETD